MTSEQIALSIIHATGGDPKRVKEAAAVIEGWKSQAECDHAGWSFSQHGRCCFGCSQFMVDWGD